MDPATYQALAARTECDQVKSLGRMLAQSFPYSNDKTDTTAIRVNHAIIGLAGEVGELACALQKWIYYGQVPPNVANMKEEAGDCLWYIAQLCNALGFNMGDLMAENIAKLKARYPDKYSDYLAAEENRDRNKESAAARLHTEGPEHVYRDGKCDYCGSPEILKGQYPGTCGIRQHIENSK